MGRKGRESGLMGPFGNGEEFGVHVVREWGANQEVQVEQTWLYLQ